jgi:protein-tyrosine-phosphatase
MDRTQRAAIHRALGDEVRLQIVDELSLSDRTPQELGRLAGLETNLLAHHLRVLEDSGLISRRVSSGDRRRRYVSLEPGAISGIACEPRLRAKSVVFVCTHNSARSQVAEALFRARCGVRVQSSGPDPRQAVHPKAIQVGAELGVDISDRRPKSYAAVAGIPDLVVSVCDLATEGEVPFHARRLHWSIPDPVETGRITDFRSSFAVIERRVDQLVSAIDNDRRQP